MTKVRWVSTNCVKFDCFGPRGVGMCAKMQVKFGIRGGLFGYFLPKQKVTKEKRELFYYEHCSYKKRYSIQN